MSVELNIQLSPRAQIKAGTDSSRMYRSDVAREQLGIVCVAAP
jgi:hypothetical protein